MITGLKLERKLNNSDLLISIFEHYYNQVYGNNYRVNKDASRSLIENFYKRLTKKGYNLMSIGKNFLEIFILFQFEYWKEKETKRHPTLNWFIGKKAIERFEAVEDWDNKIYWILVNLEQLKPYELPQEPDNYENELRKKYLNTEQGLLFCLKNTTLYNGCIWCVMCKVKEECKLLLKENYPNLWKKRINQKRFCQK